MSTFQELGLKSEILEAIDLLGFTEPTKIQESSIPAILNSSEDLIALAQTGTGKTGAFGFSGLQKIDPNNMAVQMLVLSPTRELAIQIAKDIKDYAKKLKNIKTVAVYGGAQMSSQIRALNNGCQIVVGTPGRMLDLIRRGKLDVTSVQTLVLDEADEMLNMGFQDDLDDILEDTPAEKQTLLFSATMPKEIVKIAKKYMQNPREIKVGERNSGAKNVQHYYYMVYSRDRFETLKRIVDMNPGIYGIIFCRTRAETTDIAARLNRDGYDVDLLNGDLSQAQRDNVMGRFRDKDLQLLVATDVAARGLDVDDLTHVINYNLPDDLEVYIHRSGRTGRAGKEGISLSIIHTGEKRKIRDLERMSGKEFTLNSVPTGEEICEIRMLSMLDTVKEIKIDDESIQKFLPQAMEKLAEYDREELIKHFLSVEFNRFLDYYRDSPDLNVSSRKNEKRSKSSRDDDFYYERYFINIGRRDGLNPVRLMGMVNDSLNGEKPDFGKIDLQHSFSFFDMQKGFGEELIQSIKGTKFDGRKVIIEPSEQEGKKNRRGGGGRRRGKRNKGRRR